MEGRKVFAEDAEEKVMHLPGYDKCYTKFLEDVVDQCLEPEAAKRPTIRKLLFLTREGLRKWEKAYGRVDGQEVPAFANMVLEDEEFKIGNAAPSSMGGSPRPKKRKAEEDLTVADGARPAKTGKDDGRSAGHPISVSS
jgi:hypothetical protein